MKKGTVILLVVAVGLAAFVYFYELRKEEPAVKDETKAAFTVSADDVVAMSIRRGNETLAFEKRGTEWRITQPIVTEADATTVETLVRNLTSARISRTLAPATGAGQYGLETPALTIEFKGKDAKAHSLKLGAKDFQGWSVYAQVDGAKDVVLLPTNLLSDADKPLAGWRDRRVVQFEPAEVEWFELQNAAGRVKGVKQGESWRLEQPKVARADVSAIRSLLDAVSGAKAVEIASESVGDGVKFGLVKPAAALRIGLKGGGEKTLFLGKKAEKNNYAREAGRPMVFIVEGDVAERLGAKFADLRDTRLLPDGTSEFTKAVIRRGGVQEIYEQNAEGQWKVVEPVAEKDKAVQRWKLFEPFEERATEILDAAPANVTARLAKPAVVAELTDKAGKTMSIRFSEAVGDKVYARSSAGPEVFVMKADVLKKLDRKPSELGSSE